MKSKAKFVALSALIIILLVIHYVPVQQDAAVIQGHHPLVIQGHSPIDFVVTDPNGFQTGCVSGLNVTNIPGSTFSGCGTEPETVTISNPVPGIYSVKYVGTANGSFTITSITCSEQRDDRSSRNSQNCANDPDDIISQLTFSGSVSVGSLGQTGFNLSTGGILTNNTVPVSINLTPDASSNSISATNYFSVSYTSNGSPATAEATGSSLAIQADPNTLVTISGVSSSSNQNAEEWCFYSGCADVSFNSGATGATENLVYYDTFSQNVSDSIVGGGSPVILMSYIGMPISPSSSDSPTSDSIALSSSQAQIHVIRGSSVAVPTTVAGVTGERWVTLGQTAWSITSSNVVTNPVVYYHQFELTVSQSGLDSSATGTVATIQVGSVTSFLTFSSFPYSQWVNASSTVSYAFSSPQASSNSGEQFRLSSVSGPTSAFAMNSATTITGNYIPQFQVTFQETGLDNTAEGIVLNAEGNSYSATQLPVTLWVDYNGLTYSFVSPITSTTTSQRFSLSSTTGLSSGSTLSGPVTITGNYALQYKVIFAVVKNGEGTTNPAVGIEWLNAGGNIQITALPNPGYGFKEWQVSTSLLVVSHDDLWNTTLTANGPGTITAKFVPSNKLTLSVSSGSVLPGGHTSTVATIVGASQTVTLSVANANQLPSGISVSFAQNPVTDSPSGVQDTVSISVSNAVVSGTYTIVIQTVGSNGQEGLAVYTLTVT